MKKVLIALDFDLTAQKVAEQGFLIAKAMNAEVILLHVITEPEYYSSTEHVTIMGFAGSEEPVPVKLDSVDELKKVAQKFLEKSRDFLGDKTIQILVKEGKLAETILTAVKDLQADLIVMGSHSRKRSFRKIMGSVTRKVLQHTSKPILIIPIKKDK